MRNLIIESCGRRIETDFSKTSVAHVRNAVILSNLIGADILAWEKDFQKHVGQKYDNIICSYASPYMKYKMFVPILENNPDATLWWMVNDHDLEDNPLLRQIIKHGKRKINMLCNNPRDGYRGWILRKKIKNDEKEFVGYLNDFIDEWHTHNLNVLLFDPTLIDMSPREKGLIYYGTYRKWRLDDMLKYQGRYLTLSASSTAMAKYKENGVDDCQFTDKLIWTLGSETLKQYKYSLYVEDIHTHENFAHMANRFYEALMCGCITFFDESCRNTIEKSGYEIDERCIVSSKKELEQRIINLDNYPELYYSCLEDNKKHIVRAIQEKKELNKHLIKLFGTGEEKPKSSFSLF